MPSIGCPVDLDDVDILAGIDGHAAIALAAGRRRRLVGREAVERLGEDSRHRGLADAARAGEQIRMGDPAGLDGVLERLRNRVLPDHVVEGLRTIFPG